MSKKGRILIIDDSSLIQEMMAYFLNDEYEVKTASTGDEGIALAGEFQPDLVISDINMPGRDGISTLLEIKKQVPNVRTALMTSYEVENYIRLAKEHDIGNIITKTDPFNVEEVIHTVENLITGERVFGLENYLTEGTPIIKRRIRTHQDMLETIDAIEAYLQPEKPMLCRLALDELISNAIWHAPVNPDGSQKYEKGSDITLEDHEVVEVNYGKDNEKYGVSVIDSSGSTSKQRLLEALDRQISGAGMEDISGRGTLMIRKILDRCIINIAVGKKTEIIVFNYYEKVYSGYKPLYINQL
ncbi:MAG: response regulator [Gemmatimonadetes bacterium]|nr:MAG: response regulator [Gemmatimonadota bacterium]